MKIKQALLLPLSFLLISCSKKIDTEQTLKEIKLHKSAGLVHEYVLQQAALQNQAFEDYFHSLSLEEKICQIFIENLESNKTFTPNEELTQINPDGEGKPLVAGGYLLFAFNLADTPEEVISFTSSIQKFAGENNTIPPFLAIDQEGGVVNRLKKLNGPLPSCKRVSEKLSSSQAYQLYAMQAKQMKALGLHMNLAPVVEVLTDDNRLFLDDRSFGNLEQVTEYSIQCVKAYQDNGIDTVIKHFPGNSNTDPHTGLPEINLSLEELNSQLVPFYKVLDYSPSGVLLSHARTQCVDPDIPSCLSRKWVTDILKNEHNYQGIVFSDDIFMGALAYNGYPPKKAAVMAVNAGIDCIMLSGRKIAAAAKVLYETALQDKGFEDKICNSARKILMYKLNKGLLTCSKIDGQYVIKPAKVTAASDAVKNFETIKKENQKFYMENFNEAK